MSSLCWFKTSLSSSLTICSVIKSVYTLTLSSKSLYYRSVIGCIQRTEISQTLIWWLTILNNFWSLPWTLLIWMVHYEHSAAHLLRIIVLEQHLPWVMTAAVLSEARLLKFWCTEWELDGRLLTLWGSGLFHSGILSIFMDEVKVCDYCCYC